MIGVVGAMNDRTGRFVCVYDDGTPSHLAFDAADHATRLLSHHRRAWYGDVFFDHVTGVIDPAPAPLVEPQPYLLVCHYRDFDWTAQHQTQIREYADVAALIADATNLVASERSAGSSNVELWEVYGVRTIERRPRARKARRVADDAARLLDAIRATPDDDAARLVWADAVGGERGELVVLQTDLARGNLAMRDTIARKRRQRELLAKHGGAWSELAGHARRVSFRRGFVDAAEIDAATFLAHADDILEAAPLLESLTLTGLTGFVDRSGVEHEPFVRELLPRLFADPAWSELRGLDLVQPGFMLAGRTDEDALVSRPLGDDAIELVVASGALKNLRALGIRDGGAGAHGVRRLIGSRSLHEVERLALRDYLGGDGLVTLLQSGGLTALRALDIGSRHDLTQVAPVLPASVVELAVGHLDDAGLAALARSPLAATLERLDIGNGHIRRDPDRLAAFPKLRALSYVGDFGFGRASIESSAIRILTAQFMPALRELAIIADLGEASTRLLGDTLGPQLELLDLRRNHHALRHLGELKAKVAGELRVGSTEHDDGLLRVGRTHQAPWWDHVTVG